MSKDESKPSPRDNVLFETACSSGLGRECVFLVYDQSVALKIPSDLAGITLAPYDGTQIEGPEADAAVRKACHLINDKNKASQVQHLLGEWVSRYPNTFEDGRAPSILTAF